MISNQSFMIANCKPLASKKQPMCHYSCPEAMLSSTVFKLFSMKTTLRSGEFPPKTPHCRARLSNNTGHCPVGGHDLSRSEQAHDQLIPRPVADGTQTLGGFHDLRKNTVPSSPWKNHPLPALTPWPHAP
jgi:hypothetical protein